MVAEKLGMGREGGFGGLGQLQRYQSEIVTDSSSLKKKSFPTNRMVCVNIRVSMYASVFVC